MCALTLRAALYGARTHNKETIDEQVIVNQDFLFREPDGLKINISRLHCI